MIGGCRIAEIPRDGLMNAESSPAPNVAPPTLPTILVVEDEESIRTIVRLALETKGYRLLTAADGAEGIQLAQQHQGPIDLVITDVLLPGMSGSNLVRVLLVDRPALHVLYISGYLGTESELAAGRTGKMTFLPKPFTPRQLVAAVAAVFAA